MSERETRTVTCIRCPRGCAVTVELIDGLVTSVNGNSCRRGDTYARAEVTSPMRMVTSSVPVTGSENAAMVSVKTASDVPKDKVVDVVRALRGITLTAPVAAGDVVVQDVCGTGVDVIATRSA